jgi:hypothetical protein
MSQDGTASGRGRFFPHAFGIEVLMRLTTACLVLPALILAACADQPERRESGQPLQTVQSVDLERYLGLWFEIARYDSSFGEGCEGVTAEYAMREDGRIAVVNTCYEGALDGPVETAEGRGRADERRARSLLPRPVLERLLDHRTGRGLPVGRRLRAPGPLSVDPGARAAHGPGRSGRAPGAP